MYSLFNQTKTRSPRVPYREICYFLLPGTYSLTIIFVGDYKAKKLNKMYRKENHPANVLTFPIDKKTGEIVINLSKAKKEYEAFGLSYTGYVGFLLIHGILHLKGNVHGTKMEQKEKEILEKMGIK